MSFSRLVQKSQRADVYIFLSWPFYECDVWDSDPRAPLVEGSFWCDFAELQENVLLFVLSAELGMSSTIEDCLMNMALTFAFFFLHDRK